MQGWCRNSLKERLWDVAAVSQPEDDGCDTKHTDLNLL
jgi:hypothetical protein